MGDFGEHSTPGRRPAERRHELCACGIAELSRLYRARAISPVEVTREVLDRIEKLNPKLNAFLVVLSESALAAARAAELQFSAGIDLGPLQGVPVSVKDTMTVQNTRTTAASKVLREAPHDHEDATAVRRLRAAGAVLVGKTNLDEFGAAETDPDSPFGIVQNPRKIGHQLGGSSTGSAAAVAGGLSVVSLGTDAGGSVRHPASVGGIVGLKPTYGLVPLRGVISSIPRLDHVGLLARSVFDVAAGLAVIAGYDPSDEYSLLSETNDYAAAVGSDVRYLRLGLPTNRHYEFGDSMVLASLAQARHALLDLGLTPVPIELPRGEEANDVADAIIAVDSYSYHQRYAPYTELYGRPFMRRFQQWREVSADQYARAREAQIALRREWLRVFERVDVLMLPANATGAPPHGQNTIELNGVQESMQAVNSRFNRVSNLTGFPALVVPIGETSEGLPIGVQLIGPPLGEARLLGVGHVLERAFDGLQTSWGIEPRT